MECTRCKEAVITKNGYVRDKQRYLCKSCGYNFVKFPKRKGIPESVKGLAYVLYLEGVPFRGIERILKVSHVSVMNWVKTLPKGLKGNSVNKGRVRLVEIGEMWHYIGKKREKHGYGSLLIEIPEKYSHGMSAIVEKRG